MMPRRRSAASATLLGATLFVQGCAQLASAPPIVEVQSVQLAGLDLFDQSLAVSLCVTNPNPTRMAFRRVVFHIAVNGAPFASGTSLAPIGLPPGGSVAVPLSVGTTIVNLGPQLASMLVTGQLAYVLTGSVGLAGLPFDVPFSRAGSLSVLRTGLGLLQAGDTPARTRCDAPSG